MVSGQICNISPFIFIGGVFLDPTLKCQHGLRSLAPHEAGQRELTLQKLFSDLYSCTYTTNITLAHIIIF